MRKIIHLDMDCFYAAVEMRERPGARGQAHRGRRRLPGAAWSPL